MELLRQLAQATRDAARAKPGWAQVKGAAKSVIVTGPSGARLPAGRMFEQPDNLLIMGPPGAGKTTLLRSRAALLAQRFIQQEQRTPVVRAPLLVGAAQLKSMRLGKGLLEALARCCEQDYLVHFEADELAAVFRAGRIELLVDGLDELGLDWNQTVGDLSDLFRATPQLRAIVSSRPAALTVNFTNFVTYSIPPLDRSRALKLLQTLGTDQPEAKKRFVEEVLDRPELGGLTLSPLMVSMLYEVFLHQGRVPINRSLTYSLIVDILFDRERAKHRHEQLLSPSERHRAIAAIAVAMETRSLTQISGAQVRDLLSKILPDQLTYDALAAELTTDGLFVEHDYRVFGFVHRSFQEFFVASYFRDDPAGLIPFLDEQHGDDILEFASGLIENVAPLIEKAVTQGKLVLAAKMLTSGRYDNKALKAYVAHAFHHALGTDFIALLATELGFVPPQIKRSEVYPTIDDQTKRPTDEVEPPAAESVTEPAVAKPFEVTVHETLLTMLDGVRNPDLPNEERGRVFEEFSAELFGQVFLVAERNQYGARGEIDLLLDFEKAGPFWLHFGNEALVECKNLKGAVSYPQATTFITKVRQSRRKMGFIVSFSGFSENAIQALSDNMADPLSPAIVAITGNEIRQSLQSGEAIDAFLKERWRRMAEPKRRSR